MSTTPKNIESRTSIYVMKDPTTLEVKYVGKTVQTLISRLGQHIADSYREKNHRAYWIQSIVKGGKIPLIEEIDHCTWKESKDLEVYYIAKYKSEGYNLVNETEGGEGTLGRKVSEETKEKMRKAQIKKLDPVYQYDLDGNFIKKWENAPEAAEFLGAKNASGITRCVRKERFKYKNFIWTDSYNDNPLEVSKSLKESTKQRHERNVSKSIGESYTQCYVGKLASQESKLINTPFVYVYDKDYNLIYEGISLSDAATFVNKDMNRDNIDITSRIVSCIKNNSIYYDKYIFSNNAPENYINKKSKALLIIIYNNSEYYGIEEASKYLGIPKQNILNNIKNVTKTTNSSIFGKIKLEWKANSQHDDLFLKTYGLTSNELTKIGHDQLQK